MAVKDPTLPPAVVAGLLCLIIGGGGGYYARYMAEVAPGAKNLDIVAGGGPAGARTAGPLASAAEMPAGADLGAASATPAAPTPGGALARLVRSIDAIEALQGQGLSADQKKAMLPILTEVKSAGRLDPSVASQKVIALEKALSPAQQAALRSMSPPRTGQGDGDPESPFASGRNQKALDDLITKVSK